MSEAAVINMRIDKKLKADVEAFAERVGLPVSAVMAAGARKVIRDGKVEFLDETAVPNQKTAEAMREADGILKGGEARFAEADEMFLSLGI
jgi:addiction module RelB/DinJ family antitoxin